MYKELLKLCDFDEGEIEEERVRVDKAFRIAQIEANDCKRGEARIREYFDIELESVRKVLGIWMREFIDMVLAKEEGKKIIYGVYPTVIPATMTVLMATGEDVYLATPEILIDIVMGQIFDKINPILEEAEKNGLGPGLAHCSLMQARLGAIAKGIAPVPDLLFTTGFWCDQSPKTDELIHEVYQVPVIYADNALDSNWDVWPDMNERQIRYFANTLRRSLREVGEAIGHEITEKDEGKGLMEILKEFMAWQRIQEIIKDADPVPLSMVEQILFYLTIGSPMRRSIGKIEKIFDILRKELKERVAQGKGVVAKGAPRVLIFLPSFVDPSTVRMIERELGIAIPCECFSWFTPRELTMPTVPEAHLAEYMLRKGIFHSTSGLARYAKEYCEIFDVDGFIFNYLFSCRPVATSPLIAKRIIEKELGIPVLVLEYDIYDSRDYSTGQVRTRLETFAEMLKARKAAKA